MSIPMAMQPKPKGAGAVQPAKQPAPPGHPVQAPGVPRFLASPAAEHAAVQAETGAPQLLVDLAGVAIHDDEAAHRAAQGQRAAAFTAAGGIYFNRGAYNPTNAGGRALLAHELTHVAQQQGDAAGAIQHKTLADAPVTARQQLEVPSAPVTIPVDTIKEYFEPLEGGRWGSSRPAPAGVAVELGGIDAKFKTPMTSLAMYLFAQVSYPSTVTGAVKPIFGPGTTLTLQLALAKHGLSDGAFRFAWTGDDQSGVIYVEALAAGPKAQNKPESKTGAIAVGGLSFTLAGSWTAEREGYLKQALALIPLEALKQVDALTFKLESGGGGGEDGRYEEEQHTIVLLTSLFDVSDVRFGASPKPVQEIAHEIGHAIDLAPLRAAWKKYEGSGKAGDLTGAASLSGSKWEKGADDLWQMAERLAKVDGDFRKAAAKDGVAVTQTKVTDEQGVEQSLAHLKGGVSDYGNTNWTELFAESFALYTTDPATFKLLRPALAAYFEKRFPRQ